MALDLFDYVDLGSFGSEDELITYLTQVSKPYHEEKHKYCVLQSLPGCCEECGWFHPDQPADCSKHKLVDHAKMVIQWLQDGMTLAVLKERWNIYKMQGTHFSPN